MNFNERLKALKESLNNRLTKESPKEELDFIAKANEDLDSLQKDYDGLKAEKSEIQEMYIKSIRTSGSTEMPKEEISEQAPRTLEEIGAEIIKNRKDGGK